MTKSQINLPKTAFSMKANLPTREPEILEYWKKINLYEELRNESKGRESGIKNNIRTENLLLYCRLYRFRRRKGNKFFHRGSCFKLR